MIKISKLSKAYGANNIFDDLNLSVKKGKMIAITGDSGSGKSTLLNIIGSLETFDSGYVEINNRNIKKMNRRKQLQFLREEISFLFQNYGLMENYNVKDNIIMGQKLNKKDEVRIEGTLRDVNLPGFQKRMVHTLSGGEQQRVALARIILKPSKLILADEPTGNLDDTNSSKVWDVLLQLSEMGKTVVVVTHDKRYLNYFDSIIHL